MKRKKLLGTTAIALTAAVAVAGCSAGGQNAAPPSGAKVSEAKVQVDKDGSQSKGPAPDGQGSRKGGTLNILWRQDVVHYDPAQTNSSPEQTISEMLMRRLTMYKIVDGKTFLVGDLA